MPQTMLGLDIQGQQIFRRPRVETCGGYLKLAVGTLAISPDFAQKFPSNTYRIQ